MGTCGWAGSCRSQPRDSKWTSLSTEKPTHEAPRILWERIHAGALGVELCLVLVNGAFYRDSQRGGTTDLCCFTPTCNRPSPDLKVPLQQRFRIYLILGLSGWKLIMTVHFTWMLWKKKGKKYQSLTEYRLAA